MKKPVMNIRKIIGMNLNSAMKNVITTSEHIVQELEKAPIHWNTPYEPTVTAIFSKKKPAYEKRLIIQKHNCDVDATIYFTKKTKIARVVWNRLVPQGRGYHDTDLPSINTALKAKDILSTNAIMDVLFSYVMRCNVINAKSDHEIEQENQRSAMEEHLKQDRKNRKKAERAAAKQKASEPEAGISEVNSVVKAEENPVKTAVKTEDDIEKKLLGNIRTETSIIAMGVTQPESEVAMKALRINISDKKNKIISHMFGKNLEYNHHEMSRDETDKAQQAIDYLKLLVPVKIMQANPMTIRKADMLKKYGNIKAITDMPDEVRIRVMVNRQSEVKYIVSDGACFSHENDQNVNTMLLLNENMKVVAIVYAASVDGLACGRHEHMAIYVMKYLLAHGIKRVKEMFWMTDITFENANAYASQMIENVSCMSFTKTDPQTRECFISKMIKNLCDPICSMAIGNNLLRKMAIA